MVNIALSTALSWDSNWNPGYAVDITKEFNLESCQIFPGNNFTTENAKGVKIIGHAPVDLNSNAIEEEVISSLLELKDGEKPLNVVFHHDYMFPVEETLSVIKKLNSRGIVVLLENYYKDKDKEAVLSAIDSYIQILIGGKELKLFPLIDIPRLFIDKINNSLDSLALTFDLFFSIKELGYSLYLHLIDSLDADQNRSKWCPIGEGYIPYDEILSRIGLYKLDIPLIVLEFEDKKHIENSITYLNSFL